MERSTQVQSPQVRQKHPAFPARMVLRLTPRSPWWSGSFVTIACEIASQTWHQRRDVRTTRLHRPQTTSLVSWCCPRPSHPAHNVRDDREAPLFIGHGMAGMMRVICARNQRARLRQINTTGKSACLGESVSSEKQLLAIAVAKTNGN